MICIICVQSHGQLHGGLLLPPLHTRCLHGLHLQGWRLPKHVPQVRRYESRQRNIILLLLNLTKFVLINRKNVITNFSSQTETRMHYCRCPDSASDMLDFVNNFHSYFPNGVPFRDRMPWPLRDLLD